MEWCELTILAGASSLSDVSNFIYSNNCESARHLLWIYRIHHSVNVKIEEHCSVLCIFHNYFIYFVYAIAQPSSGPFPACKCVRHYLRTHNCDTHGRVLADGGHMLSHISHSGKLGSSFMAIWVGQVIEYYLHSYLGNNKHFTTKRKQWVEI